MKTASLIRVLLAVTVVISGNSPAQIESNTPPDASKCGSVVVVKCASRTEVESANAAAERALKEDSQRRLESRRAGGSRPDLGTVIIEGDRIKPLTVEEALRRAIPEQPVDPEGTHTYSIGEGALCTCMNVCPPWWTFMPCCKCSERTGSRMSTAPGTSPLR